MYEGEGPTVNAKRIIPVHVAPGGNIVG